MLNIYVQEEMPAYEIIRVAGDGLCILWAFKEYIEVATGKEVAMDDIKEKLRKEMSDTFYQTFPLSAKLCAQDEVERFLTHPLGSYDRETCDMFLAALGNVYKVNIKIYQSNLKKCWVTDLSDERKGYERTLYFARCLSAHVDAIVPKRSATNTPEKVELTKNQVPKSLCISRFFPSGCTR